jgi:hypothetical protein
MGWDGMSGRVCIVDGEDTFSRAISQFSSIGLSKVKLSWLVYMLVHILQTCGRCAVFFLLMLYCTEVPE